MKKNYNLMLLLFLLFQIQAQTNEIKEQGVSPETFSLSATTKSTVTSKQVTVADTKFTMDQIVNWIGKGSKRAAMVVQWNDGKQPDAMVWGYRWEGKATGADMIKAITNSDPRFFMLIKEKTEKGLLIGGIGYDLHQKNHIKVFINGLELKSFERIFKTNTYKFDSSSCSDNQNHWCAGWENSFWMYNVRESCTENFTESNTSATERVLQDGSWDGWSYSKVNHSRTDFLDKFTASSKIDYTTGVFFLNKGCFGQENGTLNYMSPNGEFSYDVYSKENEADVSFGVRSEFGTIFDGKLFVISKEKKRVVVADAKTLKHIATIDAIKSPSGREADGRAFVGITPELGYISTSNGICTFNLKDYTIGEYIPGTDGETGNMLYFNYYVYAVQRDRVLILQNNVVVKTITGCEFSSVCFSRDTYIYLAARSYLIKVDPISLSQEKIFLPSKASIGNYWGNWSAGSFCAGERKATLYWTNAGMFSGGTDVFCYEIGDLLSLMAPIHTIPKGQMFYGVGIRIHPTSNLMYITAKKLGDSNFEQSWVYVLNSLTGEKIHEYQLNRNYSFPAMPIFPDVPMPSTSQLATVISNKIPQAAAPVNVKNKKAYRSGDRLLNLPVGAVIEAYNMTGAIRFKVKAEQNEFKIPNQGFLIFNIISADGIQIIK